MKQDYRLQICRIVGQHISGDYSDSLTRFSYLTGTKDFLGFITSPEYFGFSRELVLIDRITEDLSHRISQGTTIIDLGPGSGEKASRLITQLGSLISDYIALDISTDMLTTARTTQDRLSTLRTDYRICDFSDPRFIITISQEQDRLFLLLGNTLTNEVDISQYLLRMRSQLRRSRDRVLLGIEILSGDIDKIVREYRSEENYILTFRPLEMIGVSREDGIIDISFNKEQGRIEEQFIFEKPREIMYQDKRIQFHQGDRILLSVTYKPTIKQMIQLMSHSGFEIERMALEQSQVLILITPD